MSILKIYGGRAVQAALAEIVNPVQVTYLALDQPAADTAEALADLSALTPYVTVNVKQEPAGEVDQVIVQAENGQALRFVGPPLGTEIAALVSAVVVAGRGHAGLSAATEAALARLSSPMHVRIFTTPS